MKHIIHVDNSEFFRKLMKTFMSEIGQELESFENGADAMEAVNSGRVNCVITGLELADMSGDEFIKRLKVAAQSLPVIVVSSKEGDADKKRLEALGVKAIIKKSGDWQKDLKKFF
jgi:two-component system cell cycle response regulator